MSSTIAFDIIARDKASATFDKFGRSVDKTGSNLSKLGGGMKSFAKSAVGQLGMLTGAAGIGGLLISSSKLEQQYSKTMTLIGAATRAPASAMKDLDALAMKMGADTAFSANEAADAMLELGKAGISTGDIMGGGLKGTLLLATAGGTNLATAATIASNAMNTFNMRGSQMSKIAAALAGGANASSASVESLGQGLQQVGPGATNAGMSLNETVAALSAFDAAGIKGSDAGTSLKTMLARLVPQTNKAEKAMEELGLDFVKGNGEFESLTNIAGQLQAELGGLSQAQRTQALTTIFGSDATRAATVLMNEGAGGIAKYIKATQDKNAAEDMAKAAMSGTAGAMERLGGAVETAKLEIGKGLAPAIVVVADWLSNKAVPAVTGFIGGMREGTGVGGDLAAVFKTVGKNLDTIVPSLAVVAGGLVTYAAASKAVAIATAIQAAGTAGATGATWSLNAALRANPIGIVVTALTALGVGFVVAYKKSETFRNVVDGALSGVKKGFDALGRAGVWLWNNALQPTFKFIVKGVASILDMWSSMLSVLAKVPGFGWAKDAADAMANAADKARGLADGIKKIPPSKKVTVTVVYAYQGKRNPGKEQGMDILPRGTIRNAQAAGAELMSMLADGIKKGGKKLDEVLATSRDRIKTAFSGIRDEMSSLSESVASAINQTDFSGGISELMASLTGNGGALSGLTNVFATLKDSVSKGFLSSLMQSGNVGLATALANDPAAAAAASAQFDANAAMAKGLGDQTAQQVLGDRFEKALADEIKKLLDELKSAPDKHAKKLRKELQELRLVVQGLDSGKRAHLQGAW